MSEELKAWVLIKKDKTSRIKLTTNKYNEFADVVERALIEKEKQEELIFQICDMFGLDNLYPYKDYGAILKGLEEYMDRKNELYIQYVKTWKPIRLLKTIKEKRVDVDYLRTCIEDNQTVARYNQHLIDNSMIYCYEDCKELTEEEYNDFKEYYEGKKDNESK